MSGKDCGRHEHERRKLYRRIFAGFIIFAFIVLFIVFIIWAVLRPSKPTFTLQDATLYAFNSSVPNFLTISLQLTLSSRNRNRNIGIYYDRLDVQATYRNQQISFPTSIPPSYQDHREDQIWSPLIYGVAVPVSPYNYAQLGMEQASGSVFLMIKADGRIRFRVGSFTSGGYHLYVTCPAYIRVEGGSTGSMADSHSVMKYQLMQSCSVSV